MLKDDVKFKACLLFFVEGQDDEALTFCGHWLPEILSERLADIPGISSICFSVPEGYKGRLSSDPFCFVRSADDVAMWKELFSRTGADHIIRLFCDSPFIDRQIVADMLETQVKYEAEFTYAENLPQGLGCEIFSRALTDSFPETEEKTLPLGQVIRGNINQFDVELFYREPDIRNLRLSFRSGDPRNRKVMERLMAAAGNFPSYADILPLTENNPEILYAGPSYLELEISGRCDMNCLFCCRTAVKPERGLMEPELLKKILKDMREFGLPYTVCFGGTGEPLLHDRFGEMIKAVLDEPLAERLIVETNGQYINESYASLVSENSRLITIVNINGADADSYRQLHGKDCFAAVEENVLMLQKAAGENSGQVYVQLMKINETEPFTDRYYDRWEERRIPVVFQKQNTWLGKIQDRRYSDLTPLERTACWHLQRDLFVLADGRAVFCKQDILAEHCAGSLKELSVSDIYEAKKEDFCRNRAGELTDFCRDCDEWYTFNF